jgi:hypothetical protein
MVDFLPFVSIFEVNSIGWGCNCGTSTMSYLNANVNYKREFEHSLPSKI